MKNRRSLAGKECFVCGDHMFSIFDGAQNEIFGNLLSADHLDNDVYLWIINHRLCIGGKHPVFKPDAPIAFNIDIRHPQ